MRVIALLAVFCGTIVTGCALSLGKAVPEKELFLLTAAAAEPEGGSTEQATCASGQGRVLVIAETESSPLVGSSRILFSPALEKRQHYQFAAWAEPPARRISALIIERFERGNGFDSVIRGGGLVRGDLLLKSELLELYHFTAQPPGKGIARVRAELFDFKVSSVISSRTFEISAPVNTYDVDGAVAALDRGIAQILNQLVDWVCAEI